MNVDSAFNEKILVDKTFDLIKEFAFEGKTIIVMIYYGGIHQYCFCKIIPALKQKGFSVYETFNENDFVANINKFDVAVVISSNGTQERPSMVKACVDFYNGGKSLFLHGDNEPYFGEINKILSGLYVKGDFQLTGNDPGDKILKGVEELKPQTFNRYHPLGTGFLQLYEGITICYPANKNIPEDMEVFAVNSSGNMSIVCSKMVENRKTGKLLIDSGFTKLDYRFSENGNEVIRYITNAIGWLVNVKDDFNFYN